MKNQEQQKQIKYFEGRAEQLKELKQVCADYKEKMDSVSYHDEMEDMRSMVSSMLGYLEKRISWAEEDLYSFISRHLNGHLPSAKSASQMQKMLDVLGIGEDYEVLVPKISVSKVNKIKIFEVELTSKDKEKN